MALVRAAAVAPQAAANQSLGQYAVSAGRAIALRLPEQHLPPDGQARACLDSAIGEGSPAAREPGRAPVRALRPWRRQGRRPRTRTLREPLQRRWRPRCRAACRWPPPPRMPLHKGRSALQAWHCTIMRMLKHSILSARASLAAELTARQACKLMATSLRMILHQIAARPIDGVTSGKLPHNICAVDQMLLQGLHSPAETC